MLVHASYEVSACRPSQSGRYNYFAVWINSLIETRVSGGGGKYFIMKNIIVFFFFLTVLSSCSKSNDDSNKASNNDVTLAENVISLASVKSTLQKYHDKNDASQKGPILDKIKKWIKAHVGTQSGVYCPGTYACGPCPGMCIFVSKTSEVVADNYELSADELNDDLRLFILSEFDADSSKYIITFINTDDFVLNDNFIISVDLDLGSNVAAAFEKDSFVIKTGTYPVVYDFDERGETVIKIVQ